MPLANLTDLRSAVADFGTGRTDLPQSVIDNFITLAENDIEHGTFTEGGATITPPLRVRQMEVRSTLTLVGEYTNLPSDFLQMREVSWNNIANRPPLKFITPEAFDSVYRDSASGPGKVWTVVGTQLRVGPGVNAGTDILDLSYYGVVPPLVDNGTNWLMTWYPNAYLYGALRHLAPYIGAMDFLPIWQSAFISSVWSIIRSQGTGSFSGTSMAQVNAGITIT